MSEDMLVYPTEKVVGVLDDHGAVDELRSALAEAGASEVEVLSGDSGEEQLDPKGDDHGPLAKAMRTVQKALGDEAERLENLNDELERGNLVVQAGLSAGDDDAREQEKRRIGKVMRQHGVRSIAFYGKNQIEELTLDA
ncbi:hypothetical protein [Egicoccus halophilus]|uniref:Heat induced stress protein YflT n=1 Tax=Egicoccus halophilus TaxID=1670830 RepID=A0A8J3ET16_9ACTN|nr:hypothetical protein [Egicoccus halophilus]GGI02853.1 hypothetical protein GCM10011354_01770 [Egicoccus halophilus]